jgi:hypothetical protein
MFSIPRVGLAVGLGLWMASGSAVAQQPCATCPTDGASPAGPRICGSARGVHPWKQRHSYCQSGPGVIHPESCFGHFKTKWTVWEQACPHWNAEPVVVPGPAVVTPPITTAPAPVNTAPAPKAMPPVAPTKESSKLTPAPAPKLVTVPTSPPGLDLPPVPDLPIGLPPASPTVEPSKS